MKGQQMGDLTGDFPGVIHQNPLLPLQSLVGMRLSWGLSWGFNSGKSDYRDRPRVTPLRGTQVGQSRLGGCVGKGKGLLAMSFGALTRGIED